MSVAISRPATYNFEVQNNADFVESWLIRDKITLAGLIEAGCSARMELKTSQNVAGNAAITLISMADPTITGIVLDAVASTAQITIREGSFADILAVNELKTYLYYDFMLKFPDGFEFCYCRGRITVKMGVTSNG